ncbi:hypothetical protein N0V93_000695 [Gnomoniopsis smithogilvyi]|uniref:Uncharacterized protein n=1 Tax=Gnomoniopsis smithogilvyi TaxID=1191159 RepID=A0A9W8Z077_9PEZI|nr:hypothetical protein N0V93_000695 [Gnomoniopsis smithogilvyi]
MDPSTETPEPKVAEEATNSSQLASADTPETSETTAAPAAEASTEPKAAVDDLAKATEDSTPFGTLKRRTTEAWNNIPKPAVPSELPQFPSIAAELPTQESARETFGTLKRRTTESFGTISRRTTDLMKNISVPSVPETKFPNLSDHVPSEMPKWADFSGLASKLPKLPWAQAQPNDAILQATWERIFVPSLPRSSHSINVVAGNAYLFGGEIEPRKPVDNDMHLLVLPYSSANADYIAIKAKAAPKPEKIQIPTVVEPIAEDGSKDKDLSEVDLTGSEQPADGSESSVTQNKAPAQAAPDPSSLGDVPGPRVGHATAVIGTRIFLFGGRGGPDMAALEEFGRVWVFDTKTNLWSYLDPQLPTVEPASPAFADKRQHYPGARSYHCAVGVSLPRDFDSKSQGQRQSWAQWAQGDSETRGTPQNPIVGSVASNSRDEDEDGYGTFIIHGGCFTEGRANDVWAFDVRSKVWQELPSAPGAPRGGTTLSLAGGKLWRFGGFNGEGEEGGQLDCLELGLDSFNDRGGEADILLSAKGEWRSILAEEITSAATGAESTGEDDSTKPLAKAASHPWPGHRSVAGLQTVTIGGPSGREYLLLLLGERDPSNDGHNAAGKFWDDVWAYELPRASAAASWLGGANAAVGEGKWFKVEADAYDDEDVSAAKGPSPRGWFASAHMGELEERGVVLWGGVDAQNTRLGDGWILRLGSEKREI